MFITIDEATAAQRAGVQTYFNIANEAVNGLEKLVQLNFRVLHENVERSMKALSNGELPVVGAARRRDLSVVERAALYNQQLLDILASTQAAIVKHASAQYESQIGVVKADFDEAAQRAPAGAQAAATAVNSAITAANAFYESIWKTARQAVETAESNLNVVTRGASGVSHAA
jgi:hypothetical protein